jgi:hypothetical protein
VCVYAYVCVCERVFFFVCVCGGHCHLVKLRRLEFLLCVDVGRGRSSLWRLVYVRLLCTKLLVKQIKSVKNKTTEAEQYHESIVPACWCPYALCSQHLWAKTRTMWDRTVSK